MRKTSRTTIATMIMLACASYASAADKRVDNLTFFSGSKAASADQALRQNADLFGLPANLDNLVLTRVQESLSGTHYTYQQMLRGLPVDRAEIVVSISKKGELLKVFNETRYVSPKTDADAVNQLYNKAQISDEQALDKGWKNMKVQHPLVSVPSSTLVWVPTKDGVQLAKKVQIEAEMPTGGFVQLLNAHDGSLLDSYSTSLPRKGGERSIEARADIAGATLERAAATALAKGQGKSTAGAARPGGSGGRLRHQRQRPGIRSRSAHGPEYGRPERYFGRLSLRSGLCDPELAGPDRDRRRVQAERPVCEHQEHRSPEHGAQHHHQWRLDGQARQ
jgi:hypothetical protein